MVKFFRTKDICEVDRYVSSLLTILLVIHFTIIILSAVGVTTDATIQIIAYTLYLAFIIVFAF